MAIKVILIMKKNNKQTNKQTIKKQFLQHRFDRAVPNLLQFLPAVYHPLYTSQELVPETSPWSGEVTILQFFLTSS